MSDTPFSRRTFLKGAAAGALSTVPLAGCKLPLGEQPGPGEFFTATERKAAGILADVVLPPAHDNPGAQKLGAIAYMENFLTALEYDPPRIYAAGPFSGRQPFSDHGVPTAQYPENDFKRYLPLTRMQEAGWRLRLYGNGKTMGLRELIRSGVRRAIELNIDHSDLLLKILDGKFWKEFTRITIEGALSAPEYGGNLGQSGWKLVHFEGDAQPLGYSLFDEASGEYRERADAPVSSPSPGKDPETLSLTTRVMLGTFAVFSGGRVYY